MSIEHNNFIAHLQREGDYLIAHQTKKRNEAVAKLDMNLSRILKTLPEVLLNMTIEEFMNKHQGDFDEFIFDACVGPNEERENLLMKEQDVRSYHSPKKVEKKKHVIRRKLGK